jgi:adenosylcobinamide-GDP ribazoletransferase
MSFLGALGFLTTIPVPSGREPGGISYFPLVGLILGLILAGVSWLAAFLLPVALADMVVVVALVLLTGALHLDGFLDTCDGLAYRGGVEERLEVMSDSRAGGIGVVAVVSLLMLKYLSLNSIPGCIKLEALVMMPVMGRWAISYALFAYPYAKPTGLGVSIKEKTSGRGFTIATATASVIALVFGGIWGLIAMLGVWAISVGVASFLARRFGGLTGDTYGAIAEVCEVATLIILSVIAHNLDYNWGLWSAY